MIAAVGDRYRRGESLVALHVLAMGLLMLGVVSPGHAGSKTDSSAATKWVGTWSTAPQLVETGNNPPSPGLANNTLRQILRVSLGGDSLRMKFSNEFSTSPVTFHAVHIALSTGGGTIDSTTDRIVTFAGNPECTLAAGAALVADPFRFPVQPRTDLAVTIYYGSSPAGITGHPGSRTTSYILAGNAASRQNFTGAVTTDHWYNINAIDVLAPSSAACVAIMGNSITDGRGSTTNLQNRWPDVFSESLLKDARTRRVGVVNSGIGGNCVLAGGLGPTGVSRFDRDILDKAGIRWAVVFEGVNDIGGVATANAAATTSANLIAAYGQMITKAHQKNILIYGGTIMPFKGNGYYNQYSELCRSTVNQWIRTKGNFDGCIDFDRILRDPLDTTRLVSSFQNDGLHPDTSGHRTMGQSVDVALFAAPDSILGVNSPGQPDGYDLEQNYPNPFNGSTEFGFRIAESTWVKLRVYDLLGREVAVLVNERKQAGVHEVSFDASRLSSGPYFYRMDAGIFSQTRKLLLVR